MSKKKKEPVLTFNECVDNAVQDYTEIMKDAAKNKVPLEILILSLVCGCNAPDEFTQEESESVFDAAAERVGIQMLDKRSDA